MDFKKSKIRAKGKGKRQIQKKKTKDEFVVWLPVTIVFGRGLHD